MDLENFQNKVKVFEKQLASLTEYQTKWIEPEWFHIEPNNEKYSSISIRYEFDEIQVGIDFVKEYYSDQYGEGRTYNDGLSRFNKILHSRIKKIAKYKGDFHYRTDYLIENNGLFENFASVLTWAFPFWKKTRTAEYIQNSILTSK